MEKLCIEKKEEILTHKRLTSDYRLREELEFSKIYHEHWNKEIISFLPKKFCEIAIDCGCGTGILLNFLSSNHRFKRIYGLDLSLDMLMNARQKHKLVNMDMETLPIKDNTIEVVVCRGSLHHTARTESVIKEVHRILIPGGFFVISEPCADSWLLRLPRWYYRRRSRKISGHHKSFFTKKIIDKFKKYGFEKVRVKKFGFLAFPLCGLPDFIPVMRYIAFNTIVSRILIFIDSIFSHIPIIKHESWGVTISFKKK